MGQSEFLIEFTFPSLISLGATSCSVLNYFGEDQHNYSLYILSLCIKFIMIQYRVKPSRLPLLKFICELMVDDSQLTNSRVLLLPQAKWYLHDGRVISEWLNLECFMPGERVRKAQSFGYLQILCLTL
jgi:hypothetical protein